MRLATMNQKEKGNNIGKEVKQKDTIVQEVILDFSEDCEEKDTNLTCDSSRNLSPEVYSESIKIHDEEKRLDKKIVSQV